MIGWAAAFGRGAVLRRTPPFLPRQTLQSTFPAGDQRGGGVETGAGSMRRILNFVKTTALGGAIFLLPFAAMLLIVIKAGKMAIDAVTPLAEKLPIPIGEAIIVIYVALSLLLMLASFAAGLFARSLRIESDAVSFFEDKVLNKLPPYVAVRKYSERLAGLEASSDSSLKPVLVRIQNTHRVVRKIDFRFVGSSAASSKSDRRCCGAIAAGQRRAA
jgi:hypothetical protein